VRSAPSRGVFRVALFGLFGGAVLALWLLIRPPSVPGEETVLNEATATPALTPGGGGEGSSITPTPSAATTPPAAPTETPVPTPTPKATPTPTPAQVQYVVQDGDTWYGVADKFGVDANVMASLNHRTIDEYLHVGETLLIPQ
jgi:LysM repeat protein